MQEPTDARKAAIFLWFDGDAEEAVRFYAATFPFCEAAIAETSPADYPDGRKGDVITVAFTLAGIPCVALNGGDQFKHSEAFSFQISTETQEETDRYWNAIVDNGGAESMCGWCKDKWGVSWQITPVQLTRAIQHPDRAAAERAMQAMFAMKKIDIAAIEAAVSGRA